MCDIPDFLTGGWTEKEKQEAHEWAEYTRKVGREYRRMFPGSTPYLGVFDDTPGEEFYQMMEECVRKGKPMEDLHPDYTINWDDYDKGDFID